MKDLDSLRDRSHGNGLRKKEPALWGLLRCVSGLQWAHLRLYLQHPGQVGKNFVPLFTGQLEQSRAEDSRPTRSKISREKILAKLVLKRNPTPAFGLDLQDYISPSTRRPPPAPTCPPPYNGK